MNKVFVYWNLHKKCWSVRDIKTRKVIEHLQELSLIDCEFKVSEAGRQRVIREKRKHVHAGVVGCLVSRGACEYYRRIGKEVFYNPYKTETFRTRVGDRPVHRAGVVVLFSDRRVYATHPE